MSLETPIAFFIYNRPLQTARVFSRIAEARPAKLFIIADGPKSPFDAQACDAARAVAADVDWPCEVVREYAPVHLGCRACVGGGIDSVFAEVEQAIILQDDCLPEPTFFTYCQDLLRRYEDEERLMTVSGDNFQFGTGSSPHSYYFSAVHHLWGWATWRRAWAWHDSRMARWPELAGTEFPGRLLPPYASQYQKRMMADTHAGKLDTWIYQWIFACWLNDGLCALPGVNLVSNIGFDPIRAHGKKPDVCSGLPTKAMEFPLVHPPRRDLAGFRMNRVA